MSYIYSLEAAQAASQNSVHLDLPPVPVYRIRWPQEFFNDRFERMEMRSQGGSMLGLIPVPDDHSSDHFRAPDNMRFGRFSAAAEPGSPRDGFYRGASIFLWREISARQNVFLEFYTWSLHNRMTQEHLEEPIRVWGVRVGVEF